MSLSRWQMVTIGSRYAAALCAAALWIAAASAQTLNEQLLKDASDGTLDRHEFLAAALIASGVPTRAELSFWLADYYERRAALLERLADHSLVESPRAIHDALYVDILRGSYRAAASDLRTALSQGDFNCLSAATLYFDLCSAADRRVDICSLPGHVFIRSQKEDPNAEATSPDKPPKDSARSRYARRITPIELLAKFYYNRAVIHFQERQFAEGLALVNISLQLDPADPDARENLLAGLNNWAVEHCKSQRYQQALALLQQGLSIEPSFAPLIANAALVRRSLERQRAIHIEER